MKEKTIDEIHEYFSELVSGEKPNGKIQLARIWGAYQREAEKEQKCEEVREKIYQRYKNIEIHMISDDMYIIEYHEDIFNDGTSNWYSPYLGGSFRCSLYDNFDKALIALIAMKTNNIGAVPYICKMLDI